MTSRMVMLGALEALEAPLGGSEALPWLCFSSGHDNPPAHLRRVRASGDCAQLPRELVHRVYSHHIGRHGALRAAGPPVGGLRAGSESSKSC